MSIEPSRPRAAAIATSCSNEWPASVAWLASMLTLTSLSRPNFTRKPWTVCGIEVVLMPGRLVRLGLDQDVAGQADTVLVVDDQRQEPAHLLELAAEVGVEQRVVALAPAPQHVVLAAQPPGGLETLADLRGGEGGHVGIGVGAGAGLVAPVREQVGGAPQRPDAGLGLLALEAIDGFGEVTGVLAQRRRRGHDVDVVEAVERQPQPGEEVERRVHLGEGGVAGHRAGQPRAAERAGPEHVGAVPAERVPVADRRAQPVLHAAAEHDPVLVVVAIRQRVGRSPTPSKRTGSTPPK